MHVGMWGAAVIVIAIVSWLMYRCLAPQNWKEWSRAGALQAFIIAFARKEERQMVQKFGDIYRNYQRQVPMFIPRTNTGYRQEA